MKLYALHIISIVLIAIIAIQLDQIITSMNELEDEISCSKKEILAEFYRYIGG